MTTPPSHTRIGAGLTDGSGIDFDGIEAEVVGKLRMLKSSLAAAEMDPTRSMIVRDLVMPAAELLGRFCTCVNIEEIQRHRARIAKTESEWWAKREIEIERLHEKNDAKRLRAALEKYAASEQWGMTTNGFYTHESGPGIARAALEAKP
jgi:hypothetical protein